jgi:hypothetical protein
MAAVYLDLVRSSPKPMVRLTAALALVDQDQGLIEPGTPVPGEVVEFLVTALDLENERETERLFGCLPWREMRKSPVRLVLLGRLCDLVPAAAARALPALVRHLRNPVGALTTGDFDLALRIAFPDNSVTPGSSLSDAQREVLHALTDYVPFWRLPAYSFKPWPQGLRRSRPWLRQFLGVKTAPLAPEAALHVLEQAVQSEVIRGRVSRRAATKPQSQGGSGGSGNPARRIREVVQHLANAARVTDADREVSDEDRRRVERLDLTARATNDVLAHLGRVPALRTLILRSTEVTDEGLTHLSAVPLLRDLDLCDTEVTVNGLAHVAGSGLASLERLYLANTAITPTDLLRLAGLPALRELSLATGSAAVPFPPGLNEVLPQLKEALPALRLINNRGLS